MPGKLIKTPQNTMDNESSVGYVCVTQWTADAIFIFQMLPLVPSSTLSEQICVAGGLET